jgi:hypothetical protein
MPEQVTVAAVPTATPRRWRVERRFYISVALVMILLNAVAFGPSIIDPSRRNVPLPLTPLVMVHAIASAAFLLVFLRQAILAATRKISTHRQVGIVGAVLAAIFITAGFFTVIANASRGFDLSGDISRVPPPPGIQSPPEAATLLLLSFFVAFAILFGGALWYRHRPAVHERLMYFAMVELTNTPVAHVIGHWSVLHSWAPVIIPGSLIAFLSASAMYDRMSEGRVHPVSLWVPPLLFAWQLAMFFVVLPSATWHEFAEWLIQ